MALLGREGLRANLRKAVIERALDAELNAQLGNARPNPAGRGCGYRRNGHASKTVLTDSSEVSLAVPRDRNGSCEPQLAQNRQRRLPGLDHQDSAPDAQGLSQRDGRAHLEKMDSAAVSTERISRGTDTVVEEPRGPAETATGSGLSGRLPRCHPGSHPRRGHGEEQRLASGPGASAATAER